MGSFWKACRHKVKGRAKTPDTCDGACDLLCKSIGPPVAKRRPLGSLYLVSPKTNKHNSGFPKNRHTHTHLAHGTSNMCILKVPPFCSEPNLARPGRSDASSKTSQVSGYTSHQNGGSKIADIHTQLSFLNLKLPNRRVRWSRCPASSYRRMCWSNICLKCVFGQYANSTYFPTSPHKAYMCWSQKGTLKIGGLPMSPFKTTQRKSTLKQRHPSTSALFGPGNSRTA